MHAAQVAKILPKKGDDRCDRWFVRSIYREPDGGKKRGRMGELEAVTHTELGMVVPTGLDRRERRKFWQAIKVHLSVRTRQKF